MPKIQLRILPRAAGLTDDRGEDWGLWDFTSLPRTGDHIDLERDGQAVLLTVQRVIHFAVENPIPRSELPYRQRKAPSICILALQEG